MQAISFDSPLPPAQDSGMGDDGRGAGEFGSIWTRMPIEDHYDFPPDNGTILVPFRDFPENWASAPDVASLQFLDRDFIFPGEQFHILVHVRAEDPAGPEIVTPFKVAAAMNKLAARKAREAASGASEGGEETGAGETTVDDGESLAEELGKAEWELKTKQASEGGKGRRANYGAESISSPTAVLQEESQKKRTLALLESFRKSHYYVRVLEEDEPLWKKRDVRVADSSAPGVEGRAAEEQTGSGSSYGCTTVPIESGIFDPQSAGGIARSLVDCSLLENGDIVVLLQVTLAEDRVADEAFLEVLQYERHEPAGYDPVRESRVQQMLTKGSWDPTQGLLQWLLPLDRPSSPPPSVIAPIQASPPKPALTSTNSNIFSFGHLRSSSSGSLPPVQAPPVPPPAAPLAPPVYGAKGFDSVLQERSNHGDPGSEGLLSFRGALLEPQRFAAHCGLEGPHVPGKRWRRKLSIVQPIKIESYFAHCNTQDLICVLVENILPATGSTADVVIFVDSVNVVCHSVGRGSLPLPVPISCVEVGDDSVLPDLALRAGEQHSFILRPTSPTWKPSSVSDTKRGNATASGPVHEQQQQQQQQQQSLDGSQHRKRGQMKDSPLSLPVGETYAVIVSCHCSHTESRLQYRHNLQWRPRLPRDLLLSVSLESSPPVDATDEKAPLFKTQVVTVQATNLTAKDMNLKLLAPSSLANSPLSMVSFPVPTADSPAAAPSITLDEDRASGNEQESEPTSPAQQLVSQSESSSSLPPIQSIESVIGVSPVLFRERNISAADMVADNSPARTHLWLQSVVPLGCVPAFSTTAVKCNILPLMDGIITLDTLHLSTSDHDALYIPESPLQIHTTSSIATGVA